MGSTALVVPGMENRGSGIVESAAQRSTISLHDTHPRLWIGFESREWMLGIDQCNARSSIADSPFPIPENKNN
jgi:hypothetical protein